VALSPKLSSNKHLYTYTNIRVHNNFQPMVWSVVCVCVLFSHSFVHFLSFSLSPSGSVRVSLWDCAVYRIAVSKFHVIHYRAPLDINIYYYGNAVYHNIYYNRILYYNMCWFGCRVPVRCWALGTAVFYNDINIPISLA